MGESPTTETKDKITGASSSETDAPDATLGGYLNVHDRPPAFQGIDGQPYTVSIEVESVGDLITPYAVYLLFPRWAENGLGIVGHVETEILWNDKGRDEALNRAEKLPLGEVKQLLDKAILRKNQTS
tara:strand:- start:14305 stop:14685 length:381 start_codon:yes stop_codon:yes gene_type:complete